MRDSISLNQHGHEIWLQENQAKQKDLNTSVSNLEARITELESELDKQQAEAEKRAKLMQMIWGDMFQSDSLH